MALDFTNNATDRADHGSGSSLDNLRTGTYAAWINITTLATGPRIMQKGNYGASGNTWYIRSDGGHEAYIHRNTTDQYLYSTGVMSTGVWYFVAWVFV